MAAVPPTTSFSEDHESKAPDASLVKNKAEFAEYWERTVPWTFKSEKLSYAERRRLRYELQDYMSEAIPFSSFKGKRVLEIGSGSGIDSAEFARNGAQVVSLDFTETGTRTTRDTLAEAGVGPSDVVRAAAQNLPFKDGVFDSVYSFGVLHHIPDVDDAVDELTRKLKEDGEVVFMVYNKESLLYYYSILFLHGGIGLSEDVLVSQYSERIEGCPYTRAYTADEVRSLLSKHYQEPLVAACFNVVDTPQRRKVKIDLPDNVRLGWHLVARAKRRPSN